MRILLINFLFFLFFSGYSQNVNEIINQAQSSGISLEESNDPAKRHAALRRHATGRKEEDLFNKLMEKWCK